MAIIKKDKKSKCLKLCALFLFPFALASGTLLTMKNPAAKTNASENYLSDYYESVSLANSNFTSGSYNYSSNSLSGWNAIETDSKASGMLIDVGNGSVGDDQNETTTFSEHKDSYMLSTNPGAHSSSDSRILMINSKENTTNKNNGAYKGYRSENISLEANAYYVFSISAKAMLNGEDYVSGSIYLSGLVDKDGEAIKLGYENFRNETWKEFYFYIATGDSAQTVTLDLYLGTRDGSKSKGAVFFDNINIGRWSNNHFIESCYKNGYKDKDVKVIDFDKENENSSAIYLLNQFPKDNYIVEGTQDLNLDFEAEDVSFDQHWTPIEKKNASAQIMNVVNVQDKHFLQTTGYDFVGYDLDYYNTQALVLYTTPKQTGYMGIRLDDDIQIDAQGIYKVTLKLKIAGMDSGSFYLKVSENDNIYTYYPHLLSSDSEKNNYYELNAGQTTGISANTTNYWTNNYQTVEMYLKGNPLFNTSVNLELWLGDKSTNAQGCVIVDDIMIEKSAYSAYSNASNKLELGTITNSTETFTNSDFNNVENNSQEGLYPLTASSWTTDKESDELNVSGVLNLYNHEQYNDFYNKKDENGKKIYDWAGINPNNDTTLPNNVYMMFNRKNSYQSLLSTTTSINANSYYKLTFDYYTQNYSNLEKAAIKVEIIDENGITLFSENGITSPNTWSKMEVYIHTAETVNHTAQVKVSLGDSDNKVGGYVYLDNFQIDTSENYETEFAQALYKTDLTNYYLNLTVGGKKGEINTNPAYEFTIDTVYDSNYSQSTAGSIGGVVDGQTNEYEIVNDNNLLVLKNDVACKSSLKSIYKLSLKSDTSYYVLTFDLATFFGNNAGQSTKDHSCHYGLSVTIDGYEEITELVEGNTLKPYQIYIKNSTDATPYITFSLVSDCDNSTGTAIITNLDFKPSTESVYTELSQQPGYGKTVLKAEKSDEPVTDDNNQDDTDTDTNTNTNEDGFDSRWLLISSIIMGVALIIAIIGFVLRKVKIKKIEKIKKESYDRKLDLNHDVILAEAQKRRDKEVEDLQKARGILLEEKETLVQQHKDYVKAERETNNGKLSRAAEREFKKFNSDLSRLDEKINIINEKIDYSMTADYLLTVQRKVVSEEDDKFNAEKKARKKLNHDSKE